jgi:hypothetical protein
VNWKLIAKYTVIFFICSELSGVPLGYAIGSYDNLGETIPTWVYWSLKFLSLLVHAVVIYFLARSLPNKTLAHTVLVVVFSSLISSTLLWLFSGQFYLGIWQLEYSLLTLALIVGTMLGYFSN